MHLPTPQTHKSSMRRSVACVTATGFQLLVAVCCRFFHPTGSPIILTLTSPSSPPPSPPQQSDTPPPPPPLPPPLSLRSESSLSESQTLPPLEPLMLPGMMRPCPFHPSPEPSTPLNVTNMWYREREKERALLGFNILSTSDSDREFFSLESDGSFSSSHVNTIDKDDENKLTNDQDPRQYASLTPNSSDTSDDMEFGDAMYFPRARALPSWAGILPEMRGELRNLRRVFDFGEVFTINRQNPGDREMDLQTALLSDKEGWGMLSMRTPLETANTEGMEANLRVWEEGVRGAAARADEPGMSGENPVRSIGGITIDLSGHVYVSDYNSKRIIRFTPGRCLKIPPSSALVVSASSKHRRHQMCRSVTDGPSRNATFARPLGLVCDPTTGHVYVADAWARSIRCIDAGKLVTTLAGGDRGVQRVSREPERGGDVVEVRDGSGSVATFGMPAHLAFDVGSRSLIVADITAHRIRRVRLEGNTTITCEVTTLATPEATTTSSHVEPSRPRMAGLATAPDGSIYVSFSGWMSGSLLEYGEEEKGHWIDKYSSDGVLIERIGAALGDSGRKGLVDGAPSQARFDSPSGLAVSPRGDLYICDAGNAQVRRLAARPSRVHGGPRGPWVVDSWVGSGERGWKDGRLSVAQFSYPTAIAWDSVGNGVIIGDSGSLRIRRISKAKIDLWLRELYPDTAISELVDIRRTRSDENLEIKRIREQAQELRRMRHKFKSEKKAIYEQQYDSKMKLDSEDEAMTGKKINKKSMKGIMKKQWRARAALQEGGLTDSSEMPDELGVNEMLI